MILRYFLLFNHTFNKKKSKQKLFTLIVRRKAHNRFKNQLPRVSLYFFWSKMLAHIDFTIVSFTKLKQ